MLLSANLQISSAGRDDDGVKNAPTDRRGGSVDGPDSGFSWMQH